MPEEALQAAFEIKTACDEISRRLLRWHWEHKPGAHSLGALLDHVAQRQQESPDYYDRMPDLSGKNSWQQLDTTICMRVLLDPEKDAAKPLDLLGNTSNPGAARRACNAVRTARNEAAHATDHTDAAQAAILFNEAVESLEDGYVGTAFRENELARYYRDAENYLARCGNFVEKGLAYKGTLRTLKVILGYDYLWINVRVKGGAYGVMNGAGRFGDSYFVSYRDPNLRETNEVYEGIVPYLEQFEADERDMTKFVIGTISDLDAPLLPPYKGIRADAAWFTGVTDAMIQKERDEILAVTPEDIRELAPIIRAVLSEQSICAIGNAEKVKANQDLFKTVKNLFN